MEANSLLRAITDNSVSDLAAILETGVDINRAVFCDSRGETVLPISFACAKGSVDVVKHLLQIGVDVNIPGMSCIVRNPVVVVSSQVLHKPGCATTEDG